MHCSRQFPGDALAIDECSKAVTQAFSGDIYACFPMNSMVTRRGDGIIPLSDLRVGDEIITPSIDGSLKFEPVIAFLHWSEETKHSYLRISHSNGVLTIHKHHFIPSSTQYVQANDLNIGDRISALWMDGTLTESTITDISEVEETGLCCPVTMSGTLLVDSVSCSCYSPPAEFLPVHVSHSMCHSVMAPVRFNYSWSKPKGKPEPGVHPYAKLLMTAVTGALFS